MTRTNSALVVPPSTNTFGETNDIRDIVPLREIPTGWEWLWWTLAALAVIALAVFAWRYWRRRPAPVGPPPIPPHVRAKQRLQEALRHIQDPRRFAIEVSDALRAYLEDQFGLRAPERTTEEFLNDLQKTSVLDSTQKSALQAFLEHCDLLKFAKYEPTEEALRALHESALRLVDETQYTRDAAAAVAPGKEAKP